MPDHAWDLDWLDTPGAQAPERAHEGHDGNESRATLPHERYQVPQVPGAPDPDTVEIPPALLQPFSWLMGPAGTGKTTLARAMTTQLPGTLLAATTGIAAVNLGEGTTINALLKYYDTASLNEAYLGGRLQATLGKLWRAGIRRILLDELSMMDGMQLTLLTRALQELGGEGYSLDADLEDEINTEAYETGHHGIALTVIGDFAQLPPVKAPFAFESPEWPRYADHRHTLTQIHRQADPGFLAALAGCREGRPDPVVDFFRTRLTSQMDMTFPGSTILATNDAVSRYNALRMDQLSTPVVRFQPVSWGVQRGDWKQIPQILPLKVGALVMLLANERHEADYETGLPGALIYANGDLGVVEYLEGGIGTAGRCGVRLHRTGEVVDVVWVRRQNQVPMEPGRRKQLKGEGLQSRISPDGKFETVGEITYLPVRVAYATTVHKSQGLSLDQVQINTREGFFASAGMLYVALSRARTPEGLRLIGSVDGLANRVKVSTKIRPWV